MTENEAIEILKYYDEQPYFFSRDASADYAFKMAIQALEKVQKFETIGTVEEILNTFNTQQLKIASQHNELEEYRAIGTVEHIKLTFELCKGLDAMVKMYEAIGTIEEFKALKEKSEPKKIVRCKNGFMCPTCGYNGLVCFASDGNDKNCSNCGQALDWK